MLVHLNSSGSRLNKVPSPISSKNVSFLYPLKYQKTFGFLMFSGGTERENQSEMDYSNKQHYSKPALNIFYWLLASLKTLMREKELPKSSFPEVLCKNSVLKNFVKLTGKTTVLDCLFNKAASLKRPFLRRMTGRARNIFKARSSIMNICL